MLRLFNKINKLSLFKSTNTTTIITPKISIMSYNIRNNITNNEIKDNLVKSIIKEPLKHELYIKLANLMEMPPYGKEETIRIPFEEDDEKLEFSKIDLIFIALQQDINNKEALDLVTDFMYNNNIPDIKMFDENVYSIKELSLKNYRINNNYLPSSYFKLANTLEPKQALQLDNNGSYTSRIPFLIEGLIKFPSNFYDFQYYLAMSLFNNFEYIEIPSCPSSPTASRLTRLELLVNVIENKSKLDQKYCKLSDVYQFIANSLDSKIDTIKINEIDGIVNYNKVSLFVKAIELGGKFSLDLANCLKYDEIVSINGKLYSRIDIVKEIINTQDESRENLIAEYKSLVSFYEDGTEANEKYKELLKMEKERVKSDLLNQLESNPQDGYLIYKLIKILDDNSLEKVLFNGKMMGKVDLLLKLIDLYPISQDVYYELSKQLDGNEDNNIRLLNGESLNKKDLLIKEMKLTNSNSMACFEYSKFLKDYELKSEFLTTSISLNPKYSPAYFNLGCLLHENGINEILIKSKYNKTPNSNLIMTRKEIILKSLHLEDETDPMNCNNPLALYYLAIDMSENEIQFGKNRIEILNDITKGK